MSHSHPLRVLVALSIAAGACAPVADNATATDEGNLHETPTGRDSVGGTIVVHGPRGAGPLPASKVTVNAGPAGALGSVLGPFLVGTLDVRVSTESAEIGAGLLAEVAITSGAAAELTVAGVQLRTAGGPPTFGYPGAAPVWSTYVDGSGGPVFKSAGISATNRSDGSAIVAVAPGSHLFAWGMGDGVRVDATAGETTKLDLWDYAQRRVAKVFAPESRDLPDACQGTSALQARAPRSEPVVIDLKAGTSFDLGQHPRAAALLYGEADVPIDIRLPCNVTSSTVALGALGAGPREFRIGRLDVDHVAVTMDDGTVKKVPGRYQVYLGLGQGSDRGREMLDDKYPTGTGVDLPPGTYTLVVEYPTSAGTTAYSTQTFTLP